jgi:hypothetical protein
MVLAALLCAAGSLLAAQGAVADDPTKSGRGGASAASTEVVLKRGDRGPAVETLQRALGVGVDGVFGKITERAVKRVQRSKGLVVDGVVGPQTRQALGLQPFSSRALRHGSSGRGGKLPAVLLRIAECESGGDPTAVSPNGLYRGKYQFHRDTWRGLGGSGDPADAPEWRQDELALKLYQQQGTAPWPSCGS